MKLGSPNSLGIGGKMLRQGTWLTIPTIHAAEPLNLFAYFGIGYLYAGKPGRALIADGTPELALFILRRFVSAPPIAMVLNDRGGDVSSMRWLTRQAIV